MWLVSAALFPKKVLQIPQVALPVNELANALSSLIKTARFILHAANEPRTMLKYVFEGKSFLVVSSRDERGQGVVCKY
jgi:hypothetical protein